MLREMASGSSLASRAGDAVYLSERKLDVLDMLRVVKLKHLQELEGQKKIFQEKIQMKTWKLGPICM